MTPSPMVRIVCERCGGSGMEPTEFTEALVICRPSLHGCNGLGYRLLPLHPSDPLAGRRVIDLGFATEMKEAKANVLNMLPGDPEDSRCNVEWSEIEEALDSAFGHLINRIEWAYEPATPTEEAGR